MKALQKAEKDSGELALEPMAATETEPAARTPAQHQAAAVFEAGSAPPRRSMVIPVALLAFLVLGGGGAAYVYFATQPVPLLATPRPMPAAPVAPPPVATNQPTQETAAGPSAAVPVAGVIEPPSSAPPTAARETTGSTGKAAAAQPASTPPPVRRAPSQKPRGEPSLAAEAKPAAAKPERTTRIAAESGDPITISRMQRQLSVNPSVLAGYSAIEAGRYAEAEAAYRQALGSESQNVDAMLGLAAALVGQGHAEEASRHYVQVLQLDPRNTTAQAGLIAILGAVNPEGAEERLKQLAAVDPAPFVQFTLGNVYAGRGRWDEARARYADAWRGDPANAEYAYNLAISLDHLKQYRPALDQYRKALDLAAARPGSAFDPARVSTRIAELERAPEQQ